MPIRSFLENWLETEKTEKYISPFGKMLPYLEDIKAEIGNKQNLTSPLKNLYPTINTPECRSRLGSSKIRTKAEKDESRSVISGTLEACTGSCYSNSGPCGAGACAYLPHETTLIFLKQQVSKGLGEMIAIKMVLHFILEKLHQNLKFKKALILSGSQSSVGLLTLGWEPIQHTSTAKVILTEMEQIKRKCIEINIHLPMDPWTCGDKGKWGSR